MQTLYDSVKNRQIAFSEAADHLCKFTSQQLGVNLDREGVMNKIRAVRVDPSLFQRVITTVENEH